MDPRDAVEFALEKLGCSQKELALRLGVSPTQITKWKNGEYMSSAMESRVRELTGIGEADPSVVRAAGTLEDATKWQALIVRIADMAIANSETGYGCEPLEHPDEMLLSQTFDILKEMGVAIPTPFPKELEDDERKENDEINENDEEEDYGKENPILENSCSALILRLFESYCDVWGFFHAYDLYDIILDDAVSDAAEDMGADNIYDELMSLAATKIKVNIELAPDFPEFARKTRENFHTWLTDLKRAAIRAGVPLRAEVMDLLHCGHDQLALKAEAEWLGANDGQIHPDIYINELLVNMRIIRKILPAIMKKLGIDDVEEDRSELSLHGSGLASEE